jgi:imidazolonepropionase-like amidohydrolase
MLGLQAVGQAGGRRSARWASVVAALGLAACSVGQSNRNVHSVGATSAALAGEPAQAITNVTSIDPASGGARHRNMTIIVRGARIVSVGPATSAVIPAQAVIYDATGRYLIPGLWDAHVHLTQAGEKAMPLFVANGVTSVRDMGSDFAQIQRWKSAREAGAPLPRILSPGPKIDGGSTAETLLNGVRKDTRVVATPDDARRAVDDLKAQGVDFIKVHNRLTPELYNAIVAESHKAGLTFSGHLPVAGPLAAAAVRQHTIEHGRGMLMCATELWSANATGEGARTLTEYCAPQATQAQVIPALVRARTWFTPTLVSWRGHAMVGDPGLAQWLMTLPGDAEVWPDLRRHWVLMSGLPPRALERSLDGQFGALAAEASRAGIPLLAGSDLGDPYVIPGYALHDELALMVAAGVTPLAALQSATSEPAKAFGLSDRLGAIRPGQMADLVLLDADPLADIHNTRKIHAVMLNGRWLAH